MLDLTRDYFSLFGLKPGFSVDGVDLIARYQDIQAQVHPDRYANKSEQERRLAVQMAAFVNEAYQCLKTPLLRAQYLLELQGHPLQKDTATHSDAGFLLEQIEWREQMEAVSGPDSQQMLDNIVQQVNHRIGDVQAGFSQAFAAADYSRAMDHVMKWQFLAKLQWDAEKLQDHIDQD